MDVKLALRMAGVAPSAIGSILRLGDRTDVISLAGGLPADDGLPAADVREVLEQVLRQGTAGLQYGDTNGLPELREWIGRYLRAERGISADPSGILVTHGSQQGIDLVCKALLDPGDVVVVDRPSYLGALQVFRLFQADLRQVPLATDLELAKLETALRAGMRPRMLYLVSNFANPTGVSLSVPQRHRLAELAQRYGFAVLEDDPYGEIWFGPRRPEMPAIAGLTEWGIYLGSFSKTLFPGTRIGYVSAPPALGGPLRLARQAADLGNSDLLQRIAYGLVIRTDYFRDRVTALRTLYRRRRDALVEALDRHLPKASFEVPTGGFFVWLPPAGERDAADLLREAIAQGVSFVPGEPFYVTEPDRSMARLSFSCLPADRADTAVARLAHACEPAR